MSKLLNFYFLRRAAVLPDLWSISKSFVASRRCGSRVHVAWYE